MILAQDIVTGEVIGFCEIAMLLRPISSQPNIVWQPKDDAYSNNIDLPYAGYLFQHENEGADNSRSTNSHVQCVPTIANLVVSPAWRRRGVAKGLIKSAERIVARKWNCSELGLYVEKANQRAKELYSRTGYEVASSILSDEDYTANKWYMSKPLNGKNQRKGS